MEKTFAGRHVMVDAFVEDANVLRDKNALGGMLTELALIMDMCIVYGPEVVKFQEDPKKMEAKEFEDCGGLSGFCIISTSHISFHTWPLKKYISMDIYSCKDFDAEKVANFIFEMLKVSKYNLSDVTRRKPA